MTNAADVTPPAHPLDQSWYVHSGDKALGPYTGQDIKGMIGSGKVIGTTNIALAGGSEWRQAGSIPFFASLFAERSPPPLPNSVPKVRVQQDFAPQGQAPQGYPAYAVDGHRFAGFWIRTGAHLIDSVCVTAWMIAVAFATGLLMSPLSGGAVSPEAIGVWAGILGWSSSLAYYIVFTGGTWQATPGKRMLGIQVIRTDGQKVGYGLAFGRMLAYVISSITVYIGFFMVGWTDQKKALHDMICSTRVIHWKV